MATFPPKKGNSTNPPAPSHVTGERGPISTGQGGIPASLKVKAAGTHDLTNKIKTVQEF